MPQTLGPMGHAVILLPKPWVAGLWLLAKSAGATQTFKPECTLPPPGTNFVSGPNTRSTLGILWNCLSIIILCTWSIQHLNIPVIRGEPHGFRQRVWWNILDATVKMKWMVVTVMAPEYLVGKALVELLITREGVRPPHLTKLECYMANMGYYVIDIGESLETVPESASTLEMKRALAELDAPHEGQPAAYYINYSRLQHRYWALNASQLGEAFSIGMIDQPAIPSYQLAKLDKGGIVVKLLALLQVIYLVVQLAARKAGGLPSSQLEVASLAFAVSSGITYLLYWDRPQGVETTHVVQTKTRAAISASISDLRNVRFQWDIRQLPLDYFRRRLAGHGPSYTWFWLREKQPARTDYGPIPIPNDASHVTMTRSATSITINHLMGGSDEAGALAVGAVVGGAIFGGLHLLAWNFQFPTPVEATIWRVCSVITTCLPIAAVPAIVLWVRLNPTWSGLSFMRRKTDGDERRRAILGPIILVVLILPYVLARIIIMIEIFRTLCYLPPDAYIETWSGMFPHWT